MATGTRNRPAPPALDLRAAPGVEATFLPGDPARTGQLALWSLEGDLPDAKGRLQLVLPAGSLVRRRNVDIRCVDLHDVLDQLLELPADAPVSGSLVAHHPRR